MKLNEDPASGLPKITAHESVQDAITRSDHLKFKIYIRAREGRREKRGNINDLYCCYTEDLKFDYYRQNRVVGYSRSIFYRPISNARALLTF